MSGPRSPKCVERDEAREKSQTVIGLMKHAVGMLESNNQRRAFLQAIKRAAKGLYEKYRGSEPIKRPASWEVIPLVRDSAFCLTERDGEFHITHTKTWIRLKSFDSKQDSIEWAQWYWLSVCNSAARKKWAKLNRGELLKIVCLEMEGDDGKKEM